MNDRMEQAKAPNRDKVKLDDDADRRYWCQELRCTEGQLREAVDRVGSTSMRVRAFLGR